MNGCWDSEFDTSIEEIMCLSMKWKDSLCSPSLRSKGSEGVLLFYLGPRYNTKYSLLNLYSLLKLNSSTVPCSLIDIRD